MAIEGPEMRAGINVLEDDPGQGSEVERHRTYKVRLRMWLPKGERVRQLEPPSTSGIVLEDDGYTYVGPLEMHRGRIIAGLFYGIEGMRIGGTRRLKISPHLAYGGTDTSNIPGNAALTVEITVVDEC